MKDLFTTKVSVKDLYTAKVVMEEPCATKVAVECLHQNHQEMITTSKHIRCQEINQLWMESISRLDTGLWMSNRVIWPNGGCHSRCPSLTMMAH